LVRHEREAACAARANDVATREQFLARLLARTTDTRNLRCAWDYLSLNGGQAPGVDRMRFDDLDGQDVWTWARTVGKAIRDGTYRPAADLPVSIPKGSGRGTRTLSIPTVTDRVVQRAIVQVLQPYLDPQLSPNSYSYRPQRNTWQALARGERIAKDGDCWVLIADDIRDAFDQVPQQRLLDVLRRQLPNDPMLGLLKVVVTSESGRGLRQGGSLSPLLLNLYLDHFLDRPMAKKHPTTPLLRVSDDLLVLCRSREEAQAVYKWMAERLGSAAMPLKGTSDTAIHDLGKGEKVGWLGYHLSKEGEGLRVNLAEKAWDNLRDRLIEAHACPDSPLRAQQVIEGWIGYLGPCYDPTRVSRLYARVRSLAQSLAFEELPPQAEFRDHWQRAYARWCGVKAKGENAEGQGEEREILSKP
jgi:group II intron reverse transcriptase/maturase